MKVFHYTNLKGLEGIETSGKINPGINPFLPQGDLPDGIQRTGLFALTQPLDPKWTREELPFTNMLGVLDKGKGRGLVLLEIDIDGLDTVVLDWAPLEVIHTMEKFGPDAIPVKYKIPDAILFGARTDLVNQLGEAEGSRAWRQYLIAYQTEAYLESAVPLDEYLRRERELDYYVPEVFVMFGNPISAEGRVKISNQQPLLERYLSEIKNEPMREQALQTFLLTAKGELDTWHQGYLERQKEGSNSVKGEKQI